ncbi:uncharacterized protein NEMAJ01_0674 [Nematocida major]|uniref:uncharacterized protein n=1 Tax=Nematocida major TaxID=1912982 RepID=UPI002007A1CF|nr:uncharacterized protein NEMAJ01_0674 [Nematocida major]KAH9385778.1 hypothetical protein NEMAJ01_0674 [Nematocida major]
MKIVFIINLLISEIACQYLSHEISLAGHVLKVLDDKENQRIVCPWSSLSMTAWYICNRLNLMAGRRMYMPDISSAYTLQYIGVSEKNHEVYKQTRTALQDQANQIEEQQPSKKAQKDARYRKEFCECVIKMFPSAGEVFSIFGRKGSSFTWLLRKECEGKQAIHLLASLFLLSEGMDIKIKATPTKIVIQRKHPVNDFVVFEADEDSADAGLKFSLKEAEYIINFFKQYKEGMRLPTTREKFLEGDFLNSPQFLIQMYMSCYLKNLHEVRDLVETINTMLINPSFGLKGSPEAHALYDCLFISESRMHEALEYMQPVVQIEGGLSSLNWFPFADRNKLPMPRRLIVYNRSLRLFSKKTFAASMEIGLYALCCCLAYDPEQGRYIAESMSKRATADLKEFFRENSVPERAGICNALHEWVKVVSDLPNESIKYRMPCRNQLEPGILNFFHVIAHITGTLPTQKPYLDWISTKIKGKDPHSVYNEAYKCLCNLVHRLSVNKNIKLDVENFGKNTREDGTPELFGKLILSYWIGQGTVSQRLVLEFTRTNLHISLPPINVAYPSEKARLLQIAQNVYRRQNTFVGQLFAHYIDLTVAQINCKKKDTDLMQKAQSLSMEVVKGDQGKIKTLLLEGCLHSSACRLELIDRLCMYGKGEGVELTEHHPISRFISNIIGNTRLEELRAQRFLFSAPILTGVLRKICPSVGITESRYKELFKSPSLLFNIYKYANSGYEKATDILLGYLKAYKRETGESIASGILQNKKYQVSGMFKCLFLDNTTRGVEALSEIILAEGEEESAVFLKKTLDFVWLGLAIVHKRDHPDLIAQLYAIADPDALYKKEPIAFSRLSTHPIQNITSYIRENKKVIIGNSDNKKLVNVLKVLKAVFSR